MGRAQSPPIRPQNRKSGERGGSEHGQARDATAAGAPVALTPHLTGSNRAGKGPVAGTWAAHRLVCSPPPPTPAALHGDVGALTEALSAEHRVSSERRRGEGRTALERRWGTRGGTIAERCRRSWTHPLRQLPTYRATARRDRRSQHQQSPRGCRAKTASLFGSLLERAQEPPQNQGFSGSSGSCRASKPAEALCRPLNMACFGAVSRASAVLARRSAKKRLISGLGLHCR